MATTWPAKNEFASMLSDSCRLTEPAEESILAQNKAMIRFGFLP
jgi:hypothetical protein